MLIIDELINKIDKKSNPTCVGLDTSLDFLPNDMRAKCTTFEDAAKQILEFNVNLVDKLAPVIPAVKVQVAYYEMLGYHGMWAFAETLKYAKSKGLFTIADVKRNDIGSTAGAYSKALLSGTSLTSNDALVDTGFPADFVTINGYLGSDGVMPFVDDAKANNKGMFVLVKTSNPASAELQNLELKSGGTVYEKMGELVTDWGKDLIGEYGYSSVGAVVGATKPEEAKILRAKFPNLFFLIPGYGAQGGTSEMLKNCFDENGKGGIVNNSRGILCAYRKDEFKGMSYADASYAATVEMQIDLAKTVLGK